MSRFVRWRTTVALWLAPWLRDEMDELARACRWAEIKYEITRDV